MARPTFRDQAVVARHYDLGEADRIEVLITRAHGVVRAVAKGVRKNRSRFGARLEPFALIDVLLPDRPDRLVTLYDCQSIKHFGTGIIDDYSRYLAGNAMLELAAALTLLQPDPFIFDFLLQHLEQLNAHPEPLLVAASFTMVALAESGWAPSLFNCGVCGQPGPHAAFHAAHGGAVCSNCAVGGLDLPVKPEVLRLLWYLGERRVVPSELLADPVVLLQAAVACKRAAEHVLEQALPAFELATSTAAAATTSKIKC